MKRTSFLAGFIVVSFFCFTSDVMAQVPAFPGAEGSGRFATGGRGGDVYEVTNLTNDANSGSGSIVDALSAGNRTIVFRLSGTIELGDEILEPQSNTTIAGQTAPGDGICIKGRMKIKSGRQDIIVRYIRLRVDEGAANSDGDAIDIAGGSDIIIDHVSASYARDEGISCQDGSDNVTVQWCIISEGLNFEGHSYGSLVRGEYGEEKTYHHNLYTHNKGRNPRPGNYTSIGSDPDGLYFDFRNNVAYNWSGGHPGYNADTDTVSRYNFVGNVFIEGLNSSWTAAFKESSIHCYAYWSGNGYGSAYPSLTVPSDQWDLVTFNGFSPAEIDAYKARSGEITMEPVTTSSAAQALDDVLGAAGASFPVRDAVDTRIVNDVINGTGTIIDYTSDLNDPWPTLSSLPAPADSDHDGMPDAWETSHGLNPSDAADRNDYDLDTDYTNLEVYLNGLIGGDNPPAAPTNLVATPGDGTVGLDWDDNSEPDLDGYYVYRATTSGGYSSPLNGSPLSLSQYTDNSVTNGTTYYYVVTAVDVNGNESGDSNEESVTPGDSTPPAAPTGLSATAGEGTVSLDWNDNGEGDLDGYYVYRSTTSGSYSSPLNGSPISISEYTDNSVTNGTTYYYVVTAVDTSTNESGYSNEDSATPTDMTAPAAPTGLAATPGDGSVSLDWDDNSEGDLDGYYVYRSTTSGSYTSPLNGSPLTESQYTDNSVTNGTAYYYVVTAVDTTPNESDDSNEVSATPSSIAGSMGTVLREWWTGISGSSVSDLNSHPDFPDNPTSSNQLTSLEAPTDWADSYGTLISGYLHPPTSGSYTFWIASDANSELWLSTDGNPENASMIANVPGDTNPRQWDKYPAQQSSPISLTAGQKYYIEVLHKEDTGSDNLAVAWSGPGISQQVIHGIYLSPWFIGLYGDSTGNGIVDMNDMPDFIAMWLEDDCAESSAWDLNGDCIINFYEFSILAWNWLRATEQDTTPPAAPTGLSATPGDGTVSLDWNNNSEDDLDGYNIYRSTTSGSGYSQLNGSLLSNSDYTDNSVTNNTTYYYVVTAVDTNNNESSYSNEASATPSDSTPPSAPTGLSATPGDGTVSLDWNNNPEGDLDGYNIYRSTTSGSGYSQLNGSLLSSSDYTDNSVTNGTTYYYVVTAVDTSSNESGYSNEASATPSEPVTSITIQENETGFCDVDGSIDDNHEDYTGTGFANTDNASGNGIDYRINILTAGTYTFTWRYSNGGSGNRLADLIINSTTEESDIDFPVTTDWDTWTTTASGNITLTTGIKDVRLEATTGDGLANIDYMEVTGPNLQAESCP